MSFVKCHRDDCSIQMVNGEQIYEKLVEKMAIYPTGITCVDNVLDGGIMSGEVTEISGPVASGKTQFALTFSAIITERSRGRVLYVDTTGSFSPLRLTEIIVLRNPKISDRELKSQLSNFMCISAVDCSELLEILEGIRQNLNNVRNNLKVVIIDHVGTILSSLVPKDKVFGFNRMMLAGRLMKILAKEHNLAVLTINQCVSFTDKPVRPALGQWWFSVPDLTILFGEQGAESVTKAKVIKSCRDLHNVMPHEKSFMSFKIEDCGTT